MKIYALDGNNSPDTDSSTYTSDREDPTVNQVVKVGERLKLRYLFTIAIANMGKS